MPDPGPWLRSLRRSHERLAELVEGLAPADLRRPSFCGEWTIAQVVSHLGSGAEIASLHLDAGLAGGTAPSAEAYPPVWDGWNARDPESQVADGIAADAALLARLEGLGADQLAAFRLDLFGMSLDSVGLLRMRLSEHAVHTWDVAVALEPGARVAADAVELLVDGLGELVGHAGKPSSRPATVAVATTDPRRTFVLVTDGVRLEPGDDDRTPDGTLELPAEALLRLVYGRLGDARSAHGAIRADGVDLKELRALFPGF